MSSQGQRRTTNSARLRLGASAIAGGATVALASLVTASAAFADDTTLVMSGSGIPVPPSYYVNDVAETYLGCDDDCTPEALATPQGLWPITGVNSLTLDDSLGQGVDILDGAIADRLDDDGDVTVFGYSQSASIASLEMQDIADGSAGFDAESDQLEFMLVGDPSTPNGGLLERFNFPDDSNPTLPAMGLTFSGATPETEYPTTIYNLEYDGFVDFPKYPLNLLADLNAVMGGIFVHLDYPNLTADDLDAAVEVPASEGYDGNTTYEMLPTDDLPLLEPVRTVPVAGPLIADLTEPDLKVLINLGYGDPEYGWVDENADVPTPLALFPSLDDLAKAPGMLVDGAVEGVENVVDDLADPSEALSFDDNPLVELLNNPVPFDVMDQSFPVDDDQSLFEAVGSAASRVYSLGLATADVADTVLTTLPAKNIAVFASELADGDLLGAIGYPAAITTGLPPVAGLLEFLTVSETALFAGLDLASPFVDVSELLP